MAESEILAAILIVALVLAKAVRRSKKSAADQRRDILGDNTSF